MLFRCSLCSYLSDLKSNMTLPFVRKHSSKNNQSGQLVHNEGQNVKKLKILGHLVKENRPFVKNDGKDVKSSYI